MRVLVATSMLLLCSCTDDPHVSSSAPPADAGAAPAPEQRSLAWSTVLQREPTAFFGVAGASDRDVWIVGADKGSGPAVLHFDGATWERVPTGHRGDLWWVAPTRSAVYFAGAEGTILRRKDGAVERLKTPGLGRQTLFGLWASDGGDVWAVGGAAGRDGFVWHLEGDTFTPVPLPLDIPRRADGELPGLLKVWGDGAGAVWVVGDRGAVLRSDAGGPLRVVASGTTARLFTVAGHGADIVAVGGTGTGVLLEGSTSLVDRAPAATPLLQGVTVGEDGVAVAVGQRGSVLLRDGTTWRAENHGQSTDYESLHAVYRDPSGGIWAVGGNVLSASLDAGVVLHAGAAVPAVPALVVPPPPPATCPAGEIDPAPHGSIARRWNEQALGAIRRALPRPGVHARNLFHLSAAMYDAWSAYEDVADGWLVRERAPVPADKAAARRDALSHAAYRVLRHRYGLELGAATSLACFDAFMAKLGLDPANAADVGDTPIARGNRIGNRYVTEFAGDGANESRGYADTTGFASVNPPLVVDEPGATVVDLARWQPLNLSVAATQNGIILPAGVQTYVCPHWGEVRPFALVRSAPGAVYVDPGPGPGGALDALRAELLPVLERTSELDETDGATIDTSPASTGNNPFGTDDGNGYAQNPVTGLPYTPTVVPRGDFGRVMAEFWADGPKSETPPGHWNTLANHVADNPLHVRRLFGTGPEVDALEWDVKTYLVLNGALHDAAIAAWELKRRDVSARPISLTRIMGGRGQSTDPTLPSYAADGLPLVPGLVELVTPESLASRRHAGLEHFVGSVVVRSWRGEPGDRDTQVGGIAWIRAVDWVPYQRRNFVTPAFPGYVSGHSTFSRSAAEVLAGITGSPWFPGGLHEFVAKAHRYLVFEDGPSVDVHMQWASYYDAADQAGQSRLWGGIHVPADDFRGRATGRVVGLGALARARTFFDGTAVP